MNVYSGTIAVKDDPLAIGTEPIPASYYYDAAWFELERKAVWMRSWINVGHVCEIPDAGSFVRREIEFASASLLIVRGKDGEVRSLHNACTHRGTQLTSDACGKRATFSCPYHRWTFGSDGNLLSAPDFERFYTNKEAVALKPVATEICGGLIFVCFDPQETLREYLGSMAQSRSQTCRRELNGESTQQLPQMTSAPPCRGELMQTVALRCTWSLLGPIGLQRFQLAQCASMTLLSGL